MRTKALFLCVVFLAVVTVAQSRTFDLTVEFVEQELKKGQNPEKVMKEILEGKRAPEGRVELLAFRQLPEESEFEKEYSSPRRVDLGGQEALAVKQVSFSGDIEPLGDNKATVKFRLNIGGEEPFLVRQRSAKEGEESDIYTQRSRQVGFALDQSIVLEVGQRSVVHVNIESSEGETVCRYVTLSLEAGGTKDN